MYCAKLTLIDRRYNTNTTAKSKHATGFKRNCLMNEWGCDGGAIASRTIVMDSLRNRFATHDEHDQGEEKDDKKFDSDASLSCWSRERDCGEKTRRRITTRLIYIFKFVAPSALIRTFNYVTNYYWGNLKIKATHPPFCWGLSPVSAPSWRACVRLFCYL